MDNILMKGIKYQSSG